MSNRSIWKMLHLLYTAPPGRQPGLSLQQLLSAGLDCDDDTYYPLLSSGAVRREGDQFALGDAARAILKHCVVANRNWEGGDMWVDYPKAFVIMPFSQPWSNEVNERLIKPALKFAGVSYARGDTRPRVSELTRNIWNELLHAGVVVADVSALNANVFYELGLAHALGKEVFILKQKGVQVPADFGGAHYHEYELGDLPGAVAELGDGLRTFADENMFAAVEAIRGS